MKRFKNPFFMYIFFILISLNLSGCAALLVGAAAGAGGYAWMQGALVKEFDLPAQKLHRIVRTSLNDLKLNIIDDKSDRLTIRMHAKFSDDKDVKIAIDALTEKTSQVKIRVGILGDKLRSEMIYSQIQKRHLDFFGK